MNRKSTVILSVGAALLALGIWLISGAYGDPVSQPAADSAQNKTEDHEAEEMPGPGDTVSLTPEQIERAGIEMTSAGSGAAGQLVFPATIAAAPTASARLDARASGVIQRIAVTLGDPVQRGQTLATIESADAADLASQRSTARARVTELKSAYERERQLFEAKVTARQDLESAQANLSVAESELARANAAASAAGVGQDGRTLAVTSPLSGRITAASAVLGSYVQAGEELFRVIDPSKLQIEAAIPARDASAIAPGDRASVSLLGGGQVTATVRSVTPALDTDSRTATAVLSLTRAVPGLQPGSFAEVRIEPSGSGQGDALSLPADAVQNLDGQDVVFVRTAEGFRIVSVTTGDRSGGRVVINSGLSGDESIAGRNAFLIKAELGKAGAEHDE